jgi:hypothetical protein
MQRAISSNGASKIKTETAAGYWHPVAMLEDAASPFPPTPSSQSVQDWRRGKRQVLLFQQ